MKRHCDRCHLFKPVKGGKNITRGPNKTFVCKDCLEKDTPEEKSPPKAEG